MEPRVIVYLSDPSQAVRAGRTRRSLQLAGITEWEEISGKAEDWRALLAPGGPVLLLRAGTWLVRPAGFGFPRPSATGRGLCALGALRPAPGGPAPADAPAVAAWEKVLASTGGDFSRLPSDALNGPETVPEPPLVYLDAVAVQRLKECQVTSLREILAFAAREFRLVHFAPLDAHDDSGLRVYQVITALHRGGAERLTLDLLASLPGVGVRTRLATLGRSLRATFPLPPDTLELAAIPARGPSARIALLARTAKRFGADLAHAHLLSGEEIRNLAATGLPVVVTVHNTRAGWPAGLAELRSRDALLLAACSNAVTRDLRAIRPSVPVRTVWNGICLEDFRPTPARAAAGRTLRRDWGFGDTDLVLLAIANPRPQKRLHLLPPILAAVQQSLASGRTARLVLVGEGIPGNPEATASLYQFQAGIDRLGLTPHLRSVGSVGQIADILAASDVLVSTSAHEGLSLAQLEALAAGLPVVTTAVGGAEELARDHPHVHLLPADAPAADFARVIAGLPVTQTTDRVSLAAPGWNRQTMAARYHWLYRRALATAPRHRAPRGLWLITNNFSTGGAQSSARRLLAGLAAQGIAVRAAVVEEHLENPTPGHLDLEAHGIPVFSVPFPAAAPVAQTIPEYSTTTRCRPLLDVLDADPPEAVLFWNLRPAFKVLLADALLDVPIFDVSPGEMYFESLATFFARPRPGLPYRNARDYGERLAGVIVKYSAEASKAAELLGAPVTGIPNGVPCPDASGHPGNRLRHRRPHPPAQTPRRLARRLPPRATATTKMPPTHRRRHRSRLRSIRRGTQNLRPGFAHGMVGRTHRPIPLPSGIGHLRHDLRTRRLPQRLPRSHGRRPAHHRDRLGRRRRTNPPRPHRPPRPRAQHPRPRHRPYRTGHQPGPPPRTRHRRPRPHRIPFHPRPHGSRLPPRLRPHARPSPPTNNPASLNTLPTAPKSRSSTRSSTTLIMSIL